MYTSIVTDTRFFQIKFTEILKGRRVKKSYFELIQKPGKVLSTFEYYQIALSQLQLIENSFDLREAGSDSENWN